MGIPTITHTFIMDQGQPIDFRTDIDSIPLKERIIMALYWLGIIKKVNNKIRTVVTYRGKNQKE